MVSSNVAFGVQLHSFYVQLQIYSNNIFLVCSLYYGVAERLLNQLQVVLNSAAKVVTKKFKYDHVGDDLNNLHWLSFKKRVIFKIALLAHKFLMGIAPSHLQELFCYTGACTGFLKGVGEELA